MSTWNFQKCDSIENSLDELIKQMGWIMSKLDSHNVKRLDTNETSIKSANGETYINGPILEMYDSSDVLRLRQGLDTSTSTFIFELFNTSGVKTVGIDSSGNATFTGDITASDIIASDITGGTITIGTGNNVFKADSNGIYLGNATFASAPFRVEMDGELYATDANITGIITGSSFNTYESGDTNYIQIDDTGFKGYEYVAPDWELNGLVVSSSGWADTYFYYRGDKYFGIEYQPTGVSLRNYDSLGNDYEFIFSANGDTYPNGDWDFSYCDSISNLITDTVADHNHGISDGTKLATSSDGVNVDGNVTFVESGGHSHDVTV